MKFTGSSLNHHSLARITCLALLAYLSCCGCYAGQIQLPDFWQMHDVNQGDVDVDGWMLIEPPEDSGVQTWPQVLIPASTVPLPLLTRTNIWKDSALIQHQGKLIGTPVHYFRTVFGNDLPQAPKALQLMFGAKDGGAFYLNGVEIARWNLPSGVLHAATRALRAENPVDFHALAVPSTMLLAGSNVLAAALYSSNTDSTNNPGLLGVRLFTLESGYLFFRELFTNQVRFVGESLHLQGAAFAETPVSFQWYRDGRSLPGRIDDNIDIDSIQEADAGYYSLVATTGAGNFATNSFGLTVLSPTRPGSIDLSFTPPPVQAIVRACVVLDDDRIVLGGTFPSVPGTSAGGLIRLMPNGTIDPTFHPPDLSGNVFCLLPLDDGSLIVGGSFEYKFQKTTVSGIMKVLPDGTPDPGFVVSISGRRVLLLERGPGDTIYAVGEFEAIGQTTLPGIARLLPDGSVDPSFKPKDQSTPKRSILVFPDGRILAGAFGNGSGISTFLVMYNADGSIDKTFTPPLRPRPGSRYDPVVGGLAFDDHLNIYAAGWFESYGDVARSNVVRILPDWRIDPSFNAGIGQDAFLYQILSLPNEDCVFIGDFYHFSGMPAGGVAYTRKDGSIDRSFILGTALFSSVVADSEYGRQSDPALYGVQFQADGRMIVAGYCHSYLDYPVPNVLRTFLPLDSPTLRIDRLSNGRLVMSWPVAGRKLVLQETKDLASGFSNVVGVKPVAHGGRFFVDQPAANTGKFYRLSSP